MRGRKESKKTVKVVVSNGFYKKKDYEDRGDFIFITEKCPFFVFDGYNEAVYFEKKVN